MLLIEYRYFIFNVDWCFIPKLLWCLMDFLQFSELLFIFDSETKQWPTINSSFFFNSFCFQRLSSKWNLVPASIIESIMDQLHTMLCGSGNMLYLTFPLLVELRETDRRKLKQKKKFRFKSPTSWLISCKKSRKFHYEFSLDPVIEHADIRSVNKLNATFSVDLISKGIRRHVWKWMICFNHRRIRK